MKAILDVYKRPAVTITIAPNFGSFLLVLSAVDYFAKSRFWGLASILMKNVRFSRICLKGFSRFWLFSSFGRTWLDTTFVHKTQIGASNTLFSHYKRRAVTITIAPMFELFSLVLSGFDCFAKSRFRGFEQKTYIFCIFSSIQVSVELGWFGGSGWIWDDFGRKYLSG